MPRKKRKSTEAQLRAVAKYQAAHDELKIRIPKGLKEIYRQAAAAKGVSLNQWVQDAMTWQLLKDRSRREERAAQRAAVSAQKPQEAPEAQETENKSPET